MGGAKLEQRGDELLEQFGLTDARDRLVRGYSGGMSRRLDVVAFLGICALFAMRAFRTYQRSV